MTNAARRLTMICLGALCLALLPTGVVAGSSQFFPETGQTSSNAFYAFWLTHGQTAILGLPVSPTFRWQPDDGSGSEIVIQVYERAVLEWHPENAPPERVQLERLGAALLDVQQADQPGQRLGPFLQASPPEPCADDPTCLLFAETNHTLRSPFADFWNANGGLAAFGYPITEQFPIRDPVSGEITTEQYFERSRFEYHPDSDGGIITLGLLGDTFWNLHKDAVLTHPDRFVTVPDTENSDPYLPASP